MGRIADCKLEMEPGIRKWLGQKITVRKKEESQGIWLKHLFCMTLLDPQKGQTTIRRLTEECVKYILCQVGEITQQVKVFVVKA